MGEQGNGAGAHPAWEDWVPEKLTLLYLPVDILDLSPGAQIRVEGRAGLGLVGQLVQATERDLLRIKALGPVYLKEITDALHSKGLRLGMNLPNLEPYPLPERFVTKAEDLDPLAFQPLSRVEDRLDEIGRRVGFKYVGEFMQRTLLDLKKTRGFGPSRVAKAEELLRKHGVKLGVLRHLPGLDIKEMVKEDAALQEHIRCAERLHWLEGISWDGAWRRGGEEGRPEVSEDVLHQPVKMLEIPQQAAQRLGRILQFVGRLVLRSERKLSALPGVDDEALRQLRAAIADRGLWLGMEVPDFDPHRPYLTVRRFYAERYCEAAGWTWRQAWDYFPEEDQLRTRDPYHLLPVEVSGLPKHISRRLRKAGFDLIGEFAMVKDEEVAKLAGVTQRGAEELRQAVFFRLARFGHGPEDFHPDDLPPFPGGEP